LLCSTLFIHKFHALSIIFPEIETLFVFYLLL
jgi:hypothetical protein